MKISDVVTKATSTFALPKVCQQLRTVLDEPNSTTEDIANVIATDPILIAKLLRLANSASFRLSQQVETVDKAVAVLGGEAIYNLVLAEAMSCAKDQFSSTLLDTDQIWLDSLFRGVLAKEIAKSNRVRGVERFFVLGLMSRLSEMVIAAHFGEVYEGYLKQRLLSLPWHAQQTEFGFTFAKANGAICESWDLPQTLVTPLSLVFSSSHKNLDNDPKTLQLAIKLTLFSYEHPHFPDPASMGADLSLWRQDEEALQEMLDISMQEAKKLQSFL